MKSFKNVQYSFTLLELIHGLDARIHGDPNCLISGVSILQEAGPGDISFLTNSLYKKHLATTKASAVILSEEDMHVCPVNAVISENPHYTYASIAAFFEQEPSIVPGIHPSVVQSGQSIIDPSASISAHCVIGKHVKIGPNVVIGPGCIIGDVVDIAEDVRLESRVIIHHDTKIGKRTRIASGAIIGSDGFGFANQKNIWHRVPQFGGVDIGNDVDIGANTTIDRGAIGNTIIEDGVKLDNLIQVGHNVKIGAHTIIAGCVAIAGSVVIGKNCMVGGATCFAGHITVCDNTMITGMTSVTKSITHPGIYSSGIVGAVPNHEFRKNNARFYRLENLMKRVKTLECELKAMQEIK